MKLISLVATAVAARRVGPPEYPAPGHINEQGGYWADQSSDQSVQRPQQPQPPQTQPPHSTQAPQTNGWQPPQCCQTIKSTTVSGKEVWLKQTGQYKGMPLYESEGGSKIWWSWKGRPDLDPRVVSLGFWTISETVGDGTNGMWSDDGNTRCLTDVHIQGVQFECGQQPQPPQEVHSCEDSKLRNPEHNNIFWKEYTGLEYTETCKVSQLNSELIWPAVISELKSLRNHNLENTLRQHFTIAVNIWSELAENGKCGFKFPQPERHGAIGKGFIDNCDTMCKGIENKQSINLNQVLSGFVSYFTKYFGDGTYY